MKIPPEVTDFISRAIQEDIGSGDVTTECTIDGSARSRAVVISKQRTVIAGLPFFGEVFRQIDPSLKLQFRAKDSDMVRKGDIVCELRGSTRSILAGERVGLNIIQRLSGIATRTSELIRLVKRYDVKIMDTRKTTPCMRFMEKYAVKVGGGTNHRFGLYDAILIKDNHIEASGGITIAIEKARNAFPGLKLEVEVRSLSEFREAIKSNPDIIMLDNMDVRSMRKAVELAVSAQVRPQLEASGNVTELNIKAIAATGVDMISVGSITHSSPSADLSLNVLK